MEKNLQSPHLNELIAGASDNAESRKIIKLNKEGKLKKIAPRLYTSNLTDAPEKIVQRNWYELLSLLYPGCILSHRTAIEGMPVIGHVFVTYKYNRNIKLPGLTIHLLEGPGKSYGTINFYKDVYRSSEARAFLENMQTVQNTTRHPKALDKSHIERKLETIIRTRGDEALNNIRDEAKKISGPLKMEKEFATLNNLISALLSTNTSHILNSDVAKARASGEPFDPERIDLFQKLYQYLNEGEFENHTDKNKSLKAYQSFAFFEGYFSNFIEGTEFGVAEAKAIIETKMPQPLRDEDSHDILGTYHIVSDKKQMSVCPANAAQLLDLLRERHKVLLAARTSKRPGQFKEQNNRAGSTQFVDWKLVSGTLKKGFDFYNFLENPFAKAAYMMFLISEVHPFLDGNGRIARVMMNAELSRKNLSKIIIPTVYRTDYIGAIKRLTKKSDPVAYINMLQRAYKFSATVYGEDLDGMEAYLHKCNAFETEDGYILRFPEY